MRAVCCSLSRNLIKSLKSFPKMINFSLFLIKLKMKSCCLRLITRAWLPPLHALQDYSSININRNTLGPGIFLHAPAHVLPPGGRQVPVLPPSQVITAHPPTATPAIVCEESVPVQLHSAMITQHQPGHRVPHPLDEGSRVRGAEPHLG